MTAVTIAITPEIREKRIIVPPINAIAPAAIRIPRDGNIRMNRLFFGFCGFSGGSSISISSSHTAVLSLVLRLNPG